MMSGTHGTEDGASALTDIDRNDVKEGYEFYEEDCNMVGIKAGPFRSKQREPLSKEEQFTDEDWTRLPDITKPAEKMRVPPPDSLGNDDLMKKMDIRVAHITYYYKNKNKLVRDIKKVELNQNENCIMKHSLSLSRISSWWDSASV